MSNQTTVGEGTEARTIADETVSRRRLFNFIGWGFIGIFLTTTLGSVIRFFVPRILYEPPTRYKVGFPFEYTLGISERFKKKFRIWIVRELDKMYVIEAKCTHLGCTPNWMASEGKFKCPCHGSGFAPDGVNTEGPAPRPLERFQVTLAEDGQIIVDQSKRFRGERDEWSKPGAFVTV